MQATFNQIKTLQFNSTSTCFHFYFRGVWCNAMLYFERTSDFFSGLHLEPFVVWPIRTHSKNTSNVGIKFAITTLDIIQLFGRKFEKQLKCLNSIFLIFWIGCQFLRFEFSRLFCFCFDLPKLIHSTADCYQNSPCFINQTQTISPFKSILIHFWRKNSNPFL